MEASTFYFNLALKRRCTFEPYQFTFSCKNVLLLYFVTEPQTQIYGPDDFQPLSEAVKVFKIEEQATNPQVVLCSGPEFTESLRSESASICLEEEVEDFEKISAEQEEGE